jgi:spore coat assembly protein
MLCSLAREVAPYIFTFAPGESKIIGMASACPERVIPRKGRIRVEIINVGDIVGRKSYHSDIYFKVIGLRGEGENALALLKGLDVRLLADAPLADLVPVSGDALRLFRQMVVKRNQDCLGCVYERRDEVRQILLRNSNGGKSEGMPFFEIPGRVLHLDGDKEYLEICLGTYRQLGIRATGYRIPEAEQPLHVASLLENHKPDILVLTGHDGLLREKRDFQSLASYRTSEFFVRAIHVARRYEPSLDDLVIIAGACQSHYEELLKAGANFASSPRRVLIHCLDPVLITEKVAFTPFGQTLSVKDVVESTITGIDGLGGVQTRGKFRLGFPKSPY